MKRAIVVLVSLLLIGAVGWAVLARGPEGQPVYIEAKPDPSPEIPARDRPEFIRANESCEEFPVDEFQPAPDTVEFTSEEVLDGLESPTGIEFLDPETAFISLREGKVLRWDVADDRVFEVIDLTEETSAENDQGLTGLAVTPDGSKLLVQYTAERSSRIVAYPLEFDIPQPEQALTILEVEQPSSQHNGGTLMFDADGNLWTSFGDGGGQGDQWMNAQDPTSPLGSILRIRLDFEGSLRAVGVESNPYIDGDEGHPWVFAVGIRNPYRMSIDSQTGNVWIADVGQACAEEVSVLDPETDVAANLGWPVFEGRRPFIGELASAHHEPVFSILRRGGWCAIVGGMVYRSDEIPQLDGQYLFTDYCKGEVAVLDPETHEAWLSGVSVLSPTSVVADPDGTVYLTSLAGSIHKLVPAG